MRFGFNFLVLSLSSALVAAPALATETSRPVNGRGANGSILAKAALADAPTPNPTELIFVPIAPCRAFSSPEALKSGQTNNFQVSGNGDFSAQGGPATGCGVPAAASAVAVNLTAISPTAEGSLNAFAEGSARPATFLVNYDGAKATGGAVVSLGSSGQMSVFLKGAKSRVAGDVTGYFLPQIQVYMNYDGTAYAKTSRILATSKLGTGSYKIDTDRNLQLCSVHVNIDGGNYYASAYPSGNSIYVSTWGLTSGTATPTDLYHNVSVKC